MGYIYIRLNLYNYIIVLVILLGWLTFEFWPNFWDRVHIVGPHEDALGCFKSFLGKKILTAAHGPI